MAHTKASVSGGTSPLQSHAYTATINTHQQTDVFALMDTQLGSVSRLLWQFLLNGACQNRKIDPNPILQLLKQWRNQAPISAAMKTKTQITAYNRLMEPLQFITSHNLYHSIETSRMEPLGLRLRPRVTFRRQQTDGTISAWQQSTPDDFLCLSHSRGEVSEP